MPPRNLLEEDRLKLSSKARQDSLEAQRALLQFEVSFGASSNQRGASASASGRSQHHGVFREVEKQHRTHRASTTTASRPAALGTSPSSLLQDRREHGRASTLRNANVKVTGLSRSHVQERSLSRYFERFGPVQSTKIVWPRTTQEHERADREGHCGFVLFESRQDAERVVAMSEEELTEASQELGEASTSSLSHSSQTLPLLSHRFPFRVTWGKDLPALRDDVKETGRAARSRGAPSDSDVSSKARQALNQLRTQLDDENLSCDRDVILNIMVTCIENADHADLIVDQLCDQFSQSQRRFDGGAVDPFDLERDTALLFVISDILHNCGTAPVRNASAFRSLFEAKLSSVVFPCMSASLLAAQKLGRMTASKFKEDIERVLRCWEAWSLYSPAQIKKFTSIFVETLSSKLAPSRKGSLLRTKYFDSDSESPDSYDSDIDGEPLFDTVVSRVRRDGSLSVEHKQGVCSREILDLDIGAIALLQVDAIRDLCSRSGLPAEEAEEDLRRMLRHVVIGAEH